MTKVQEQRRQWAINRYLTGDPIEDICRELACSKSWLYKWRERYLATDPSWSAARYFAISSTAELCARTVDAAAIEISVRCRQRIT